MSEIVFDVAEIKGGASGKRKYRPLMRGLKTVGPNEMACKVGEILHKDASFGRFAIGAVELILERELGEGHRVDLGWMTLTPKLKGALKSVDEDPDPEKIDVSVSLSKSLRHTVRNLQLVNANKQGGIILYELQEDGAKELNLLCESGRRIVLNGSGLALDPQNPDEGIWLESETGDVVARAAVSRCDMATCNFSFSALPPDGQYVLVVSSRNGRNKSYAPKKATRCVSVRPNGRNFFSAHSGEGVV